MLKGIKYWHIEPKLFSISLDNASVNDSFLSSLQENFVENNMLPCKGELFHFRCGEHIINLIGQDGLDVLSDAIDKISYHYILMDYSEQ